MGIVNTGRIFRNRALDRGNNWSSLARVQLEVKAHRTDILPKRNPSTHVAMMSASNSVIMKTVSGLRGEVIIVPVEETAESRDVLDSESEEYLRELKLYTELRTFHC